MPSQNYHNYYLDLLKKYFGASFVSWVEEKGKKSLKIKIGKEAKYFSFEGQITENTYLKLIEDLIENGKKSEETV